MNLATCVNGDKATFKKVDLSLETSVTLSTSAASVCTTSFDSLEHPLV